MPDQGLVYPVVFMPVDVAGSGDGWPIDLRVPGRDVEGKTSRGFRDDLQRPNHCVDGFPISSKGNFVQFGCERVNHVMFSMMSRSLWAGLLEDIDCVAENVIAEHGLQGPAIHYVARAIEEFVDVEFESGICKDPHGTILIEVYEHIDIASRCGFSSRDGAEHCSVTHPEMPQLALVSP